MYHFAVTILLGLALFKVVDLVEDLFPKLVKFHSLATILLGIAGVWAIDYSMFDGFGIGFREDWMSVVLMGLVVASTTSVWRAAFHWLGTSEGDAPEARHPVGLTRAA